jgi:hypothetical protein
MDNRKPLITPTNVGLIVMAFALTFIIGTFFKGQQEGLKESLTYEVSYPLPNTGHEADDLAGGQN